MCKGWNGGGADETYPPKRSGTCPKSQFAHVKPHTTYAAPEGVDIDAFYIASETSYTGYYVHFPATTHHNRTWRHVEQGWWKFATNVTVYIKSKRG
ncbi:hypothetical protein G3I59_43950 [Amycolatopsis rubida]|uniref:Uncharacterized protein n=1 Tax=Amycolatopsis rubida TaxID=112413 RepID=A0ABX0C5H7_9PSEU|nr:MULTISPECIES: hypothetical protein [Amycolatopsis]MYW97393.1 hypothetical protein [Amycolatopsis rubida]NEC62378.1 hypothetical protein [Amycolatopsis rubida]OAP22772.1 hypothetical protein A4R44_06233 [Amycolatopsis sp. M39]